jgi:nitrile hydratase
MHGFGPVEREQDEPVFHAPWEGHVYAMNRASQAQRLYNIDQMRHAIERMDPARYLSSSYYERWLAAVETNLVEKGIISREELDARTEHFRRHPQAEPPRREDPALKEKVLGYALRRPKPPASPPAPRFKPGDAVLTRRIQPKGHTRLPRYARGRRGVIHRVYGLQVLPDASARGEREMETLYSVRFDGSELWGESAEPREALYLDLWESYLEEA